MIIDGAPVYKTYKPNPKQERFHQIPPWNPRLYKLAVGGLGGGKSTACEQEQALICMKTPDGKSIACRKSVNRSEISLLEDYKKILQGVATWKPSPKWFEFKNGHKLIVVPSDEWDRFGSTQLVSFYIQEAQEVEFQIFDTLTQRLRDPKGVVGGVPYYRGLMDARGVKKKHWLYSEYVMRNDKPNAWNALTDPSERRKVQNPDYTYVPFSTYDNEEILESQSPGYVQQLLDAHKGNVAWVKMLIEGEFGFDVEGRAVYGSYKPELHDASIVADPTLPILRGWDFGYNRPAVVWCQYTRDGRLLVLREYCPVGISRRHLFEEAASLQRTWWPERHASQYRDFADIAGEQITSAAGPTDIEELESFFGTSVESKKARIQDGIEVIRQLMIRLTRSGVPRFAVDVSCDTLREALGGAYHYTTEKTEERPVKGLGYDDVCDALRYVAQLIVEEDLQPGGRFDVRAGYRSSTFAAY